MTAHCNCSSEEQEPQVRSHGESHNGIEMRDRSCGNCGGLIEVLN